MSEAMCKGDWSLGTACGKCPRCRETALDGARTLQTMLRNARSEGRPSETTAAVFRIEFSDGDDDLPEGTYVTVRVDDPNVRWSAGHVAVRYIEKPKA